MAVTDFFAGEIATELLQFLIAMIRKLFLCKESAERLILTIDELIPTITEIKNSGFERTTTRQHQLDNISRSLNDGHELALEVLNTSRWNVYKNFMLSRNMDEIEKKISRFVQGPLQALVLADINHVRFRTTERFDRREGSSARWTGLNLSDSNSVGVPSDVQFPFHNNNIYDGIFASGPFPVYHNRGYDRSADTSRRSLGVGQQSDYSTSFSLGDFNLFPEELPQRITIDLNFPPPPEASY